MKPDQARLLRMAAVLLSVACGSMAFSATDDVQKTGGIDEPSLSSSKEFAVCLLKEINRVLLDQCVGFFPGNPAV